jgi:putative component of membrane protein insertase Oxa1/YidC/SpoIIIJ protein YidD
MGTTTATCFIRHTLAHREKRRYISTFQKSTCQTHYRTGSEYMLKSLMAKVSVKSKLRDGG